MKKKICCCILLGCIIGRAVSQDQSLSVDASAAPGAFALVSQAAVASCWYDTTDAKVVAIAATAFRRDVQEITGREIALVHDRKLPRGPVVIVGTIGHSYLVDQLVGSGKLDVSETKGKWESFLIRVIPLTSEQNVLVVAGSDRRGTAYGLFHLSGMMGVSPWVWWADVHPVKREHIFLSGSWVSGEPSVRYRGIFINDEDWGMQPWAAANMDTDIKDIGPKTYARVFELLLRLKGNYIWPAMHPCTKAFYYYPENPKVADDYAIVVGGSHCEPMLRNNVCEWAETYEEEYGKKPGPWRYDVNQQEIYQYWDDRVRESLPYESVFTVGMRGVHDGSMPGPDNPDEKVKLLERVVSDQRSILARNFNRPASSLPQIFVPYKEVLSLYRRDMNLPADIAIIWPDDNFGHIRQLPNAEEQHRSGGNGLYYHLSYWGAPQDYLWLSSTSPALMAYELTKAYRHGARQLWVFNVGDIKPMEMEIQFAMDMAWDIAKYRPETASGYSDSWAKEVFGDELAGPIAAIKKEYYELAQSGKPEHLGRVLYTSVQMKERLRRYGKIADDATKLKSQIPARLQDAYFEMILYPVVCAKLMNEKVAFTRWSDQRNAMEAYDSIRMMTEQYNTVVANGKWNGMMNFQPRDLKIFGPPVDGDVLQLVKDTLTAAPLMVIEASSFTGKKESGAWKLAVIPGLGINGKGLTIVPRDTAAQSTDQGSAGVYTTYSCNLPAGDYRIEVKCMPTFPSGASPTIRYSVSLNGGQEKEVNLYADVETRAWQKSVLNGFSFGVTEHHVKKSGPQELLLGWKDPDLVVNVIEIYLLKKHLP